MGCPSGTFGAEEVVNPETNDRQLGYCEKCHLLCTMGCKHCPVNHKGSRTLLPVPDEVEAAYRLGGSAAAVTAWRHHPANQTAPGGSALWW